VKFQPRILSCFGEHDAGLGSGLFERVERLGQFDLLKAVGGENGDLQSLQHSVSYDCSFSSSRWFSMNTPGLHSNPNKCGDGNG
jgi:hypothetical protein